MSGKHTIGSIVFNPASNAAPPRVSFNPQTLMLEYGGLSPQQMLERIATLERENSALKLSLEIQAVNFEELEQISVDNIAELALAQFENEHFRIRLLLNQTTERANMSEPTKEQIEEALKFADLTDVQGPWLSLHINALVHLIAHVRAETLERCASQCETARPAGGRAWDEAQAACFDVLTHVAKYVREMKETT